MLHRTGQPASHPLRRAAALFALAALPAAAAQTPVTGRVVNAVTGAALPRVLVQANSRAVFTDHVGKFALDDAGSSPSLQLTKPGFATSPEGVDSSLISVRTTADIPLWPEAILSGTVTAPDGEPLAGLNLQAEHVVYQSGSRRLQPVRSARSDSHGNFRLPVSAGDYILRTRFEQPTDRTAAVLPTLLPADAPATTLHLTSGAELHVDLHPLVAPVFSVTLPLPSIVENQYPSFTAQTAEGVSFPIAPSHIDQAGSVTLQLPSGTFLLTARAEGPTGSVIGQTSITVAGAPVTAPALHLNPLPAIPVEVALAPGSTLPQPPSANVLNLQLEPLDTAAEGREGYLRFTGGRNAVPSFSVPPGSYWLTGGTPAFSVDAATLGDTDLLQQPLVIAPGAGSDSIRLTVSQPTGRVTALTRIAGAPASCWVVLLRDAPTLPRFRLERSSADGRLTVSNLAPGAYRILAMPFFHSADFADPAVLAAFSTFVKTVTVDASAPATLTLDAVPATNLLQ